MNRLRKVLGKGGERKGPLTGKALEIGTYQVEVGAVLGEGGFATVYRALDVNTERSMALKHFRLSGDPEAERDVHAEVRIMKALQACPYVVRLHAVAYSGPAGARAEAVVLMDLAAQTLPSFLQLHNFQLDDSTVLRIFLPVCRALQAMHSLSPPTAHRDVKAENVLLHPNGTWQLCDFGSASFKHGIFESAAEIGLEEEVIRKTTTPAYRAPELWDLWSRQPVGLPADIWALGCLLYLLCYGQLPFDGSAKLQIVNGRYTLPEGRPPALRALIKRMLVIDPLARPDIQLVTSGVEQLAQAESPGLVRPLPAAVQQAVQQQAQQQQQQQQRTQHGRTASPDWTGLAGSRATPGLPELPKATPVPASQVADELAGWASFESPRAIEPADTAPSAPPAELASASGAFWQRFGDTAAEPTPPALVPRQIQQQQQQRQVQQQQHGFGSDTAPGPLSAGLVGLQRRSAVSVASTADGAHVTGSSTEAPSSELEALRTSVSQLKEHCSVLEQLLASKTQHIAALTAEVVGLKLQQQQHPAPVAATNGTSSRLAAGSQAVGAHNSAVQAGAARPLAQQQQVWAPLSGRSTPSLSSPIRARPGDSPTKAAGHRRQVSAPHVAFFDDLNPIA